LPAAGAVAGERSRGLEPRDTESRRDEPREGRDALLEEPRFVVASRAHELGHPDRQLRDDRRERQDGARRARAQCGIERGRRSRKQPELIGRHRHDLRDLRDVASRLFHPRDVGMLGEPRHRGGQQVDAREDRHVVEQHGHGRRVGHRAVVRDEHVARHLRLEVRRRADQHGVGSRARRASCRVDGRARGLAPRARDQHEVARYRLARGLDGAVAFVLVEKWRFAARAEHDDAADAGREIPPDVRAELRRIERAVQKWRGNGRKNAVELHSASVRGAANACQLPRASAARTIDTRERRSSLSARREKLG
jgi:hypothetical protein